MIVRMKAVRPAPELFGKIVEIARAEFPWALYDISIRVAALSLDQVRWSGQFTAHLRGVNCRSTGKSRDLSGLARR
jgi:hypothetical protein